MTIYKSFLYKMFHHTEKKWCVKFLSNLNGQKQSMLFTEDFWVWTQGKLCIVPKRTQFALAIISLLCIRLHIRNSTLSQCVDEHTFLTVHVSKVIQHHACPSHLYHRIDKLITPTMIYIIHNHALWQQACAHSLLVCIVCEKELV